MIRPLRSRHRCMILVVVLLVGTLMIAGLAARRTVPTVEADLGTLVGE